MEELEQCPECLEMVDIEELEIFGGVCEECNTNRYDALYDLME
jgi:hypothetical protein